MWNKCFTNSLRFLLGFVLICSGFVKAVDPMGTTYKISEYLSSLGFHLTPDHSLPLATAFILLALEFLLGIYFIFGIRRKFTTLFSLIFMGVMTIVSLYVWLTNAVSDCGCFGDALKLSNAATFYKNIPLLLSAIWLRKYKHLIIPFVLPRTQWIVAIYSFVFIFAIIGYCFTFLPIIDFRPFKIGTDINQEMQLPVNAKAPVYQTTLYYKKGNQTKEITDLNHLPDSTWTFVDSKTNLIEEGDQPRITNFLISTLAGEDISKELLEDTTYSFVFIMPWLNLADESVAGRINDLNDYAIDHNYKCYAITSSNKANIETWKEQTGAIYPFYLADDVLLKTIIRSNPGLVLLKKGVVMGKWSKNNLPLPEEVTQSPFKNVQLTVLLIYVLLFYLLPLILVIVVDRAMHQWQSKRKLKI